MAKIIPIDGGTIRTPTEKDKITIVGSTGSGKTVGALWHLSHARFDVRPYIIIDHKIGEDDIDTIDCPRIDVGELPKYPGLYICNPRPSQQKDLDDMLMGVYERTNCGLYLDETSMFDPDGDGLTACITQGRSKRIPMIMSTQRPVGISRLCFTEAQFVQVYRLSDKRERNTARNFVPIPELYKGEKLPDFWSFYYDISRDKLNALKPVPKAGVSLLRIEARLQALDAVPRRRYI